MRKLLIGVLLVLLAASHALAIDPPASFSAEPVAGKWRRVQLYWTPTPGSDCTVVRVDGQEIFCSAGRAWGSYLRTLPGVVYTLTAAARVGTEESAPRTVLYTQPAVSPNRGHQVINGAFYVFPDWTDPPFSIEAAQTTLTAWRDRVFLESFGQLEIGSTAHGWLMMPRPLAYYCDYPSTFDGLWIGCNSITLRQDAAPLAQAAGAIASTSDQFIGVYEGIAASGYGYTIGATASNGFQNSGIDVLMHESGHYWGLLHSGSWNNIYPEDVGEDLANIQASGYGDNRSHMGVPIPRGVGQLTTLERQLVGWIDPGRSQLVVQSGEVWLDDALDPAGAVLELRIPLGLPGYFYTFEYRPDQGGALVRVHVGDHDFGQIEHVWVNTEAAIAPGGDSFIDPYRGITVSAVRVSGTRLLLNVHLPGAPEPEPPDPPDPPDPPSARCGDGSCDAGESCISCPYDCPGKLKGKPSRRYCCGNGVAEPAEAGRCEANP